MPCSRPTGCRAPDAVITDAEILAMIRAADRADAVSAEFAGQFMQMWAAKLSVHPGSPAYEWYQDVGVELDRLWRVVFPAYWDYPTALSFVADHPPEPFGRQPTRMTRYKQWWQIRKSMQRIIKACWRVNDRWERLVALWEKEHDSNKTA